MSDKTRVSAAVARAVADGLRASANSPAIQMQTSDIIAVQARVEAEVQPLVENLTNNEPAYKSKVILGSVGTMVTTLGGMIALYQARIWDGEAWAPLIIGFVTSSVALYGRLVPSKPIGG